MDLTQNENGYHQRRAYRMLLAYFPEILQGHGKRLVTVNPFTVNETWSWITTVLKRVF